MDWTAMALSLRLAARVTAILVVIGAPIAYWLTFSSWRWKFVVEAAVALPLVLPPTVLGFYLLVAMGPTAPPGRLWQAMTGHGLAFTFDGLVIASLLYSLPFVAQPVAVHERLFAPRPRRLYCAARAPRSTQFRGQRRAAAGSA